MKPQILLVEDSENWQNAFREWWNLSDYELLIYKTAGEARRKLAVSKRWPVAAIVNLNPEEEKNKSLGNRQGRFLIGYLHQKISKLPIILITGDSKFILEKTKEYGGYKKFLDKEEIYDCFGKGINSEAEAPDTVLEIIKKVQLLVGSKSKPLEGTVPAHLHEPDVDNRQNWNSEGNMLDLLTGYTVSAVVKFLFDRLGKITDDCIDEQRREEIKRKRDEIEQLLNQENIESIKGKLIELTGYFPDSTELYSTESFKAWVHDQVTAEYADLASVGKLIHAILMKKQEKEPNQRKKDVLIKMAAAVNGDSDQLKEDELIGNAMNSRQQLHMRLIKALNLL